MANSQQNACCHQLAESWDKIVRVIAKQPWLDIFPELSGAGLVAIVTLTIVSAITKQPSFEIFPELSRANKNLAPVQDKSRTSSGRKIGKITI